MPVAFAVGFDGERSGSKVSSLLPACDLSLFIIDTNSKFKLYFFYFKAG